MRQNTIIEMVADIIHDTPLISMGDFDSTYISYEDAEISAKEILIALEQQGMLNADWTEGQAEEAQEIPSLEKGKETLPRKGTDREYQGGPTKSCCS